MLSPIRLAPSMKYEQLVAAMNENMMLLENQSRTQIFKDETGKNRIIIGRLPDGTYGIVVSKEGEDVVKLFQ